MGENSIALCMLLRTFRSCEDSENVNFAVIFHHSGFCFFLVALLVMVALEMAFDSAYKLPLPCQKGYKSKRLIMLGRKCSRRNYPLAANLATIYAVVSHLAFS